MPENYLAGLRMGMLLQLAIGPMCLMVFNTAGNNGFLTALSLVAAIALVDGFYILMASLGVSKLLEKESVQNAVRLIGSLVLVVFGLNIMLGGFGINLIPGLSIHTTSGSIFLQGLVMTLSNPLTIVFWGSVLTARLTEENFSRQEMTAFSLGLVSATLLFMTAVAVLGTVLSDFLPNVVSSALNIIVGFIIIGFGIKMFRSS